MTCAKRQIVRCASIRSDCSKRPAANRAISSIRTGDGDFEYATADARMEGAGMTDKSRRMALKTAGTGTLLAAAMAAGLLPAAALAEWNQGAFAAKTVSEALKKLNVAALVESKDIAIKAPDIAENGAMVPVEIQSNIPGTKSIAVL